MRNKKVIEHKIEIFERVLWIAHAKDIDSLEDTFDFCRRDATHSDTLDGFLKIKNAVDCACGVTCAVIDKETDKYGVLVIITDCGEETKYNTLPHEAVHAADYIFDECGIYASGFDEGNEAYAHMVGFITEKLFNAIEKLKK